MEDFDLDLVGWLTDEAVQKQATNELKRYFETADGRWFEQFVSISDPAHFTAEDLLAVSALNVQVPAQVAADLLLPGDQRDHFQALLDACPGTDEELGLVADSMIDDNSALKALYNELRRMPSLGRPIASKLLAAKRPKLVPIRETIVESFVGAGRQWWAPMHAALSDAGLRKILEEISRDVVPPQVSLLRRLDVILFRAGKNDPTGDTTVRWRRSRQSE